MAEQRMRIRLGMFVAGSLAAFAGLIVFFGGTPTLFSSRTVYTLTFPEAPGISAGTPVRKSGVRIGQVTTLDIDENSGTVRVGIEVENHYRPRQNDEPVISRGLLSGDTTIDFVPKVSTDGKPLPKGDLFAANAEIRGVPPLNTRMLLNQAQGTLPNVQDALIRFTSTLQKFENVGPKAERALDEIGSLAKSSREIVPELRQTNLKVQELLGANDPEQPDTLKTLLKEVREFVRALRPLAEDLGILVRDNRQDITATVKNLRELTARGGALLSDENRQSVQAILKNAREGSEDLTKAIRLAAILVDRAEATLREINLRLAEAKGVFDNLEKATKPIAATAEPVMKNVLTASDQLAKTLAEANRTIAALNSPDGTLSRILNDPALYNALVETTASLNRTLVRAEKIAKDLEIFADKVARKPETIGIGGVVRPSTGLKEAPTAPLAPNIPYPPTPPATSGEPLRPQPLGPARGLLGGGPSVISPIPPVSSYRVGEGPASPITPLPGPRIYPPINLKGTDLPQ